MRKRAFISKINLKSETDERTTHVVISRSNLHFLSYIANIVVNKIFVVTQITIDFALNIPEIPLLYERSREKKLDCIIKKACTLREPNILQRTM